MASANALYESQPTLAAKYAMLAAYIGELEQKLETVDVGADGKTKDSVNLEAKIARLQKRLDQFLAMGANVSNGGVFVSTR